MVRHCLFTFLFLCSSSLNASSLSVNDAETMLPLGSQLSAFVYDTKKQQSVIEIDNNMLAPPASTLKVVTALAAKLSLPSNFTFDTKVHQIDDDILFKFGADPTLTRDNLQKLLQTLKAQKINSIKGDIWLDGSLFSGYEQAIGWPWDILGVCYSAPSSAITLDQNCVQGSIYTEQNKAKTRVFVPKSHPIGITNEAITVTSLEQKEQHCMLELHYANDNSYKIAGCLAHRENPLPLKFAIQNTKKYVHDVLIQELNRAAIGFKGKIHIGQNNKPSALIAKHSSASLDSILTTMLKESNNLIADNLIKIIGHHYFAQSGSFNNGSVALKKILKEKANINLEHAVIVDGSGLSRNNLITATQMMDVLKYLYAHPELGILDMLPISGVDGTLQYRTSVRYPPLKHSLQAKTGSVFGSYNIAGVLRGNQNEDLLVVQFVSNYHIPEDKEPKDNNLAPITLFEKNFFQALLNLTSTKEKAINSPAPSKDKDSNPV